MRVSKLGFLGGDVSKGMCNFVLQDHHGKTLESNFQLDDNHEGHRLLLNLLEARLKENKLNGIVVGLESTGGYENNWYYSLRNQAKKMNIQVFRINPRIIYHAAKADSQRSITDGISASVIVKYLRNNYGEGVLSQKRLTHTNDEKAPERMMHKYVQNLIKENSRSKNRLEKILYSTMPELLSFKGEVIGNWFLELLIKYPSKSEMLAAGLEGVMSIKGIRKSKAKDIYEAQKKSVGRNYNKLLSIAIKEEATDILERTKKINRLKETLVKELSKDEKFEKNIEIITSVKGIAVDSAVGFLLELGQMENYESGRNLVAYFGINPTLKQSGDKSYKPKMCKNGSSNARAIIYMMAKNVVNHEPYFKLIYEKHRKAGKSHRSAIGAIMSKLTRVLFGLLKNQNEFESAIDQLNQVKKEKIAVNKKIKTTIQKSGSERRFQNIKADNAPISARQRKVRKQEQNALS